MHANSKSSGNLERKMSENIAEKSDNNYSESTPFNDTQGNLQSSDDNNPNGEGVRSSLHGIMYQSKLSMWFLQTALESKYKFELYSEKEDAEKFDDVIFKYNKDKELYRFLQAKHKLHPEKENITIGKLLSESSKEPFSLQKYFISFRRIQQKQQYKDKIKDFIICTNVDFSKDIYKKGRLTKQEEPDDILHIGKDERYKGECYKFNFDQNHDIINKLKDASDSKRLAKELAKVFLSKEKSLYLNNAMFKAYHIPLAKEVFDKIPVKDKKNKWHCTFKKDFIERKNLSPGAKFLREAFEKEENPNINNLWNTISNEKIAVPSKFGEPATESTSSKDLPNDFIKDDEIKKFFEKLVFAVKQPNEETLGNLIHDKIFNNLDDLDEGENNDQAELICDNVQKHILTWLKDPKSIALQNKDDFFMMGREKVKRVMHYVTDVEYRCHIEELNIKFDNTSKEIQKLSTFLSSKDKIFNLISSEENFSVSKAVVYQIKQQPGWCLQILSNLNKFINRKKVYKQKAESLFSNNLLIIVCNNESKIKHENIEELYNVLASIIKDSTKKIILITESNSNLAKFFKQGDLKNYYMEKSYQIKVKDLDKDYLQNQLMEKKITFQDQERSLAYLLNIEDKIKELNNLSEEILEQLEKVLKSETLNEFILNKNIVVGNKLPNFADYNSSYYDPYYIDIPRTFSHQIIDKNSLLKCINERNSDLFAFPSTMNDCLNILVSEEKNNIRAFSKISDIAEGEFFEGRFFILDDKFPEANFEKLCNQCNKKYIHWLTSIDENNDKFKVEYSNSISYLQDFMKLANVGNKIKRNSRVIIVGDPGVGKSTILTAYFQKLDTHSWPIRINLKDHQDYIKTANFSNKRKVNIDEIIEFLCRSGPKGFESALAKSLLKYYLENGDQVILLLDEYDEIENYNQKKVIELVRSFPTKSKIWLTTRSNRQYNIEKALGNTFSYFLNAFNEKEQEKFFKEYWIKKLNIQEDKKGEHNIDEFTKKLLKHFYGIGLMKSENLIGIALQARMVADTCLKYVEEFIKCNNFPKIEINNISKINNISNISNIPLRKVY